MQIRIKNNIIPSISTMHDIAIRYIFDRPNVKKDEMVFLENGIKFYTERVILNDSERWEITRIVNALIANEKGFFDRSKQLQIEHKIYYRQMYKAGLPFVDVANRQSFNKG